MATQNTDEAWDMDLRAALARLNDYDPAPLTAAEASYVGACYEANESPEATVMEIRYARRLIDGPTARKLAQGYAAAAERLRRQWIASMRQAELYEVRALEIDNFAAVVAFAKTGD